MTHFDTEVPLEKEQDFNIVVCSSITWDDDELPYRQDIFVEIFLFFQQRPIL